MRNLVSLLLIVLFVLTVGVLTPGCGAECEGDLTDCTGDNASVEALLENPDSLENNACDLTSVCSGCPTLYWCLEGQYKKCVKDDKPSNDCNPSCKEKMCSCFEVYAEIPCSERSATDDKKCNKITCGYVFPDGVV